MTTVRARLVAGREIGPDSFADITTVPASVGWGDDGLIEVTFDGDLTDAQVRGVRIRIIADSPTDEAQLTTLADLAAQNPTTTAERLLRLERAVAALTRLAVRDE